MSQRKTGILHLSTSSGLYKTIADATKAANAAAIWLERYCNSNGYSVCAIIGISQHSCRNGIVHAEKSTKGRGRPQKVFSGSEATLPHLHIILLANPCETIRKDFLAYLNRKAERSGHANRDNVNIKTVYDTRGILEYVLRQSIAIRTVEINLNHHLNQSNNFGLTQALNTVKSAHTIIFTSLLTGENDEAQTPPEAPPSEPPPKNSQWNKNHSKSCPSGKTPACIAAHRRPYVPP